MEMKRIVKSHQDLQASAPSRLGQRLRSLRVEAPKPLTQRKLAKVMGGSASMVSMEENGERLPSPARLTSYALLFCTDRSFDDGEPKLLTESELTEDEFEEFERLQRELRELRDAVATDVVTDPRAFGEAARIWRFGDGAPITIACADVPDSALPVCKDGETMRPAYWDAHDRNYVRAASLADLDALLDLFGHLKSENPATTVRIRATAELDREEMGGHLVLLGGVAWNPYVEPLSSQLGLPVRQLPERDDVFVSAETDAEQQEFKPKLDTAGLVTEDVGLFARGPNPMDPAGTLTLCGGITTRGVRGAVLCFADPTLHDLREKNQQFIAERFAASRFFGFLMRVEILPTGPRQPSTPDLTRDDTRLLEWSDKRSEEKTADDQ